MMDSILFCKWCIGNDADPREHTRDCPISIARLYEIEVAAKRVVHNPGSEMPEAIE